MVNKSPLVRKELSKLVQIFQFLFVSGIAEKTEEMKSLSPVAPIKKFPPTSTPMTDTLASGGHDSEKCLEESYLDERKDAGDLPGSDGEKGSEKPDLNLSEIKTDKKTGKGKKVARFEDDVNARDEADEEAKDTVDSGHLVGRLKVRTSKSILTPPSILITEEPDSSLYKPWSPGSNKPGTPVVKDSSFMRLMAKKSKPIPAPFKLLKPKIDLLMVAPPMTPMTPALKDVLTPSKMLPTLVPLNPFKADQGRPLFIVHPITGKKHFHESKTIELNFYKIF